MDQYLKIIMGPVVSVEIWVPEEQAKEAQTILDCFSEEDGPEIDEESGE